MKKIINDPFIVVCIYCMEYGLFLLFITYTLIINDSLSSGNTFVSGAGGLRFKSLASQTERNVANGSPPLRHFFERSCVAQAQ